MYKKLPNRKNIRLPKFDYSQAGYYFVTICAKDRRCIFGKVVGAGVLTRPQTELSEAGIIIDRLLSCMASVDRYVVMPNHVHIIFQTHENKGDGRVRTPAPTTALPSLIRYLKRTASMKYGASLWQRGYYDHIIRDEADYLRIWQYIEDNPAKWAEDEYFVK